MALTREKSSKFSEERAELSGLMKAVMWERSLSQRTVIYPMDVE
jgi:hypothetical protein